MNQYLEEKAPPFVLGIIVGAILLAIGGFVWPGQWVTGTTAQTMVDNAKDTATVAALAPACVAAFLAEPNAKAEMVTLKKTDDWKRGDLITKAVKIPGVKSIDEDVASACAVDLLSNKKAAKKI